ncbi:MAG: protein kinase [Candidatus Hydrogenedentota bacterium]
MARDEPKIGQKIGNFEIVRELGRGAMGIVYKANQGTMNRFVALKILSGALAGDQAYIRRFHREAQAAARLNHPNIITIHDQGEAAGFHYIATEYVTGTTLTTQIRRVDNWTFRARSTQKTSDSRCGEMSH